MDKINVAELLKDCPKGMELYSPLCGKCVFDRLNMGTIICKKQNTQEIAFTSEGYYMLPVFENCECMIFPSKDQRDWSKFQRPFKDGDIVTWKDRGSLVAFIYKERINNALVRHHFALYTGSLGTLTNGEISLVESEIVFATEEEKAKLFDAIKENGYKWNAGTKTLEKLPRFKVGDRIKHIVGREEIATVVSVEKLHYNLDSKVGTSSFSISLQHEWELLPNKFDITTLKPFDKVLVRSSSYQTWTVDIFSLYSKENIYPFACVGGYVSQCIPYEENKHLLGTTDDCDDFYKTWE